MENPVYKVVSSAEELQKAFCVRSIVFVNEQHCPYEMDFDGQDFVATHFLGLYGGEPFATARVRFVEGVMKVERLAVRKRFRGNNTGRRFLSFVLQEIGKSGCNKIVLHAQAHLEGFYESFGFARHGENFMEAGIEHCHMEMEVK